MYIVILGNAWFERLYLTTHQHKSNIVFIWDMLTRRLYLTKISQTLYFIEHNQAKFNKIRYCMYILYIGSYPESGQNTTMTACMVGNNSSMCIETWNVTVKNCWTITVMYLMPTTSDRNSRICL
jgi:hypothetical protein